MQQNPLTAVMEFKKDDSITIQIMANAASIVPKACDILGISLSDSESEEDSDESRTAEISGERCPKSQQIATRIREFNNENVSSNNNNNAEVQDARPKPKFNRARGGNHTESSLRSPSNDKGTGEGGSETTTAALDALRRKEELLRKSRKRCASTPSNLGQSTSSSPGTSSREGNSNPPKRRFPSISSATASLVGSSSNTTASTNNISMTSSAAATRSTLFANSASGAPNLTPEDTAIRRKMLEDLEIFHKQMTELAAVEKAKVRLLEKFIHISNSLNKLREERQAGRLTPTEALQVVHEAGMDEGQDDADIFQGTNATTSNNLLSNTASSVNQIEITLDEGTSFSESFLDHPHDQQIFTEADLSLGAEETVVVEGEVIQDSDDVVGGLF